MAETSCRKVKGFLSQPTASTGCLLGGRLRLPFAPGGVCRMASMSRRRFLKAAAYGAAGAGVLGAMAAIADDGTNYALQGIDVSHWQGSINWNGVRSAGKRYAICKATEGLDYTDPTFATNYAGIRSAGLLRS